MKEKIQHQEIILSIFIIYFDFYSYNLLTNSAYNSYISTLVLLYSKKISAEMVARDKSNVTECARSMHFLKDYKSIEIAISFHTRFL